MIRVRLREMMRQYEQSSGEKVTYSLLADKTGLARATIEAIGSRKEYQPSLHAIDLLCDALKCGVDEMLESIPRRIRRKGHP